MARVSLLFVLLFSVERKVWQFEALGPPPGLLHVLSLETDDKIVIVDILACHLREKKFERFFFMNNDTFCKLEGNC